jgi:hypothetical protein
VAIKKLEKIGFFIICGENLKINAQKMENFAKVLTSQNWEKKKKKTLLYT